MTRDKSTFAEGDERTEAGLPNQGVENTLTMLSERLGMYKDPDHPSHGDCSTLSTVTL